DLEKALREKKGLAELERAYKAAKRTGRPVSWELEQEYALRKGKLAMRARLRWGAIVGGALAGVALIGALAVGSMRRAQHQAGAAGGTEAVEKHRQDQELGAAWKEMQGIAKDAPAIAADARLVALKKLVQDEYEKDKDRTDAFQTALRAAQDAGTRADADAEL